MNEAFLVGPRLERFEALQAALVPRSVAFTDEERRTSRELVDGFLSRQKAATRRKLAVFLVVIDVLSVVTGLRSFRRLAPANQTRLLERLFDSPIGLLRKGFWGLSTLAKLGVYGQQGLHLEIAYRLRENPGD